MVCRLRCQVAAHRSHIQHDPWNTGAWTALVADVTEAAERTPTPELLAEQKAVLKDFLAIFPTAVSLEFSRNYAVPYLLYDSHSAAC